MPAPLPPPAPARRRRPALVAAVAALVLVSACGGERTTGTPATALPTTAPNDAAPSSASFPASASVPAPPTGATGVAPATTPAPEVRPAVDPVGTVVDGTIHTADGRDRTYHLYVPASLPADGPVPLLLGLHGGTGWGTQFERSSRFDGIAEANRFLVAYPDGIETGVKITPNGRVWNGGNCCASAVREGVDDVGFLVAVIDEISGRYDVDRDRVFAAGHSNGGIMAYRLACERPDVVRAIGVQSGWMGIDDCRPSQPVSSIHIHGTADENAPFEGGRGSRSISGVGSRAALESVGMLAAGDGCATPPEATVEGAITTHSWPGCPSGTAVVLLEVAGASHAWMGHPPESDVAEALVGETSEAIDSSARIWAFFAAVPPRE